MHLGTMVWSDLLTNITLQIIGLEDRGRNLHGLDVDLDVNLNGAVEDLDMDMDIIGADKHGFGLHVFEMSSLIFKNK